MGNSSDDLEGTNLSMSLNVGEHVLFGNYPQSDADTPEPIEWLVLDNDGETALLLSKYGLDCIYFNFLNVGVTWRDCGLREWLNSFFLRRAFSEKEQSRIAQSVIYTSDNPEYGTKGGGETSDRIFCLSVEDAYKYFGNTAENYGCAEKWFSEAAVVDLWICRERACQATAYAVSHGAWIGANDSFFRKRTREWWFDNCWFWLRSPGHCCDSCLGYAISVNPYGSIHIWGDFVDSNGIAVRPALRIKVK
ncbi:MAG: DUF6273 domain-containing protein [bacterium]|nr:DUF6273 domain-containing protein [bacterium]